MVNRELLEKAISQVSPEVLALDGKVGPFLDIVQAYLDAKNIKYTKFDTKNELTEDIKTILIGDDRISVQISEAIPSWECGAEVFVKTRDNVGISISSAIFNPSGIAFETKRDSTDLEIIAAKTATVPQIDGDPRIEIATNLCSTYIELKNVLKTPSKFPGTKTGERYYVFCKCQNEMINCTGSATHNIR